VQDQIAANHPASFFIVDELMRAAGIPTTDPAARGDAGRSVAR